MNHGHAAALLSWLICLLPLTALPSPSVQGSVEPGGGVLLLRAPLPAWAYVSGGRFGMGSTPEEIQSAFADCQFEPRKSHCRVERYGDEQPVRDVELSPFRMQRYEVSVAEYSRCEQARRCKPAPYFRGAQRFARDHYPASLVAWQDARDYCAFVDARLPTEAEFERAARGSSRRVYPWGNLYNDRTSNHGKLASDQTSDTDGYVELAPVGSFLEGATPEGIFDLAGNVAEWVFDRYSPEYMERDLHDPRGPSASSGSNQRVVRGGHFESPRPDLRGAARSGQLPTERSPALGFRCVLPVAASSRLE
jgi:formylglycine-generating enzyme required for sulfatase activity